MIRVWKIARLSSDTGGLDYPSINIIARCAMYGGSLGAATQRVESILASEERQKDAELIQQIVAKMSKEVRAAFEARHLSIFSGRKVKRVAHQERARMLGIAKSTYWKRVSEGTQLIARVLNFEFDSVDSRDKLLA